MKYINLIDKRLAHLPVQYVSNTNSFARSDTGDVIDRATPELHVQNKPLVCSIGCPCTHWLFRFSILHSNKTVKTIIYIKYKTILFPKL